VLNVSGHRISTAELESALAAHADCSECACVGVPDDLTGQAVVAFCCVRPERLSSVELAAELKLAVRTTIGPFAAPKRILLVRDLPKTRSGKVMRRVLRKICAGEDLGDTSTLADPAIVGELQAYFARK
jgi:acetyl-CoA synthetase